MPTTGEEGTGKKPTGSPYERISYNIRSTREWWDWTIEFCEFMGHTPFVELVNQSLQDYSRKQGFSKPMPNRLTKGPVGKNSSRRKNSVAS